MYIRELVLYSDSLEKLHEFYSVEMLFKCILTDFSLEINIGDRSILKFLKSDEPWYYHFAFNIPKNKIAEALEFVKKSTSIIPETETGNDIVEFPDWNAQAVYFEDPAGNIVEFIARHDLENSSREKFDNSSILEISEIGTPTDEISKIFDDLNREIQVSRYSGDFERFCAAGNENGMVILSSTERMWYPTQKKVMCSPYRVKLENQGKELAYTYENGAIRIN